VLYGEAVNQTVTLTVQSGDGRSSTINLASVNNGFALDVTVATSIMPSYPSPEDIWQYGNSQQQQMIQNMTKDFEDQQAWARYAIIGTIASVIVISVIVVLVLRHQRHQDQILGRINKDGFGRF